MTKFRPLAIRGERDFLRHHR